MSDQIPNENMPELEDPHIQPTITHEDEIEAALGPDAPEVQTDMTVQAPSVPSEEIPVDAIEAKASTPNAKVNFPLNMPETNTDTEVINLPGRSERDTMEALKKVPNINLTANSEARDWANVMSDGLSYLTMEDTLGSTLRDPEAEFSNSNAHNGLNLNAGVPRFKKASGPISGETALMRMMSHLGMGNVFQVPLWHSGLYVTIKPAVETELIELQRKINAEKIRLGRQSYGLLHSLTTVFIVDLLVSFVMEHVYDTTAISDDINLTNLRDHVVCQDIQSLVWGLIVSQYPRGFTYRRSCTADPTKCNHVVEETLNVSKLQFTNMKGLTEWQRNFMATRQSKMKSGKDIAHYKTELTKIQKRRVVFNEGSDGEIAFYLRTPTLSEYIDAGHRWIAGIAENVESVMGMEPSQNDRNNEITLRGQATAMRQYSHWVEKIEDSSDPENISVIEDRETIEKTLNFMSASDTIRNFFISEVLKYINESTVSVIGIPVYDCPACKQPQEPNKQLPHHAEILPIDVLQVFFGLMTQKINKIQQR